mgnify:CR=1 FL=1
MTLNFKKEGNAAESLIILHGLFGSLDNWMTFAKKMSEHFTVYLLDARNHGQSFHDDEFTYKCMAKDVKDFMEQQQIKEAIILGHSMGGKTAMQFAFNYPHLVKKLIVADIAPKAYPVHHGEIIKGLQSLDFSVIKTRGEADDKLAEAIPILAVRQFLLKNMYWKEKDQLAWRFNLDVIANKIENVGVEIKASFPFSEPTLFVRGERSNYVLDEDLADIKNKFPNMKLETIVGSGHWIHAEKPKEFMQVIESFLL